MQSRSIADTRRNRMSADARPCGGSWRYLGCSLVLASFLSFAVLAGDPPLRVTAVSVSASASCDDTSWDSQSHKDPLGMLDAVIFASAYDSSRWGCAGHGCSGFSEVWFRLESGSLLLSATMAGCAASLGAGASATFAIDRPYWMEWQSPGGWTTNIASNESIRIEAGVHIVTFQSGCADFSCEPAGVLQLSRIYPIDIHPDGSVDALDLAEILGQWGPCDPVRTAADVNLDGSVDASDLALVLTAWGTDGRSP
jgi:hypothetical protein